MFDAVGPPHASNALVTLHGEYDLAHQRELRSELEKVMGFPLVLLDMHRVTSIDATGLAEFIRLKNSMPDGGAVRVFGMRTHIRKLFDVTGLNRQFEICDSLESASRPRLPEPVRRNARSFSRGTIAATDVKLPTPQSRRGLLA